MPTTSQRIRVIAIAALAVLVTMLALLLGSQPGGGLKTARHARTPPQAPTSSTASPFDSSAAERPPSRQGITEPQIAEEQATSAGRRIELRPSWPSDSHPLDPLELAVTGLHDGGEHVIVSQGSGSWFIDASVIPRGCRLRLDVPGYRIANRGWLVPPLADMYQLDIEALAMLHVYVDDDIHSEDSSVGIVRVSEDMYLDWGDVAFEGRRARVSTAAMPSVFENLEPGRYKVMLVEGDGASFDAALVASQFVDLRPGSLEVAVLSRPNRPEVRLAGRVLTDSLPAVGATVLVNVREFTASDSYVEAVADGDGKFFLSLPEIGAYEVIVRLGAIEQRRVVNIHEPNPTVEIELESGKIRGRVRSNEPLRHVRVSRATILGETVSAPQWLTPDVQPDGSFIVEQLPYGRYVVSLHGERDRIEDVHVLDLSATEPTADVELVSRPSESIVIRCIGSGGEPLAGLAVYTSPILDGCDHWTVAGTTDQDGKLSLALPSLEGARVYAQSPTENGAGPWQASAVAVVSDHVAAGHSEVLVQLEASGQLEVRLANGSTLVPSRIALFTHDDVRLPGAGPAYEMRKLHSLHCVPAGEYTLVCSDVDGKYYTQLITIEAGTTTVVTVDVQ